VRFSSAPAPTLPMPSADREDEVTDFARRDSWPFATLVVVLSLGFAGSAGPDLVRTLL
jgi:hypothetical protein